MNDEAPATIAQLQRDIAQMQNIVLYYQNRILRKEIAIQEIIQGNKVASGYYSEAGVSKPKSRRVPLTPFIPVHPDLYNGDVILNGDRKAV